MFYRIIVLLTLCALSSNLSANQVFTSTEAHVPLLELYSSEGCHSCPPADNWLAELKSHPEVFKTFIPIALHVDYWDYIGWKDPFANPNFVLRQKLYQELGNSQATYTPQFMLNGKEFRHWFYNRNLKLPEAPKVGALSLILEDDWSFKALFNSKTNLTDNHILHVAIVGFNISTDVKRGENANKSLTHNFIALNYQTFTSTNTNWAGQIRFDQKKYEQSTLGIIAWISTGFEQTPIQSVGGYIKSK